MRKFNPKLCRKLQTEFAKVLLTQVNHCNCLCTARHIVQQKCFNLINLGLAKQEADRDIVKLHMTLLNVKYARGKWRTFDARHILEQNADLDFGSQELNQIQLVSMKQTDPDGFYKCIASIEF